MRYPPDYKQQTRTRILEAASRLFREKGYHGVGIDAVMAEAGLTAGGFYAHFTSKEALFAAVIASNPPLPQVENPAAEPAGIDFLIRSYLSRQHRDNVAQGCPLPALASDAARGSDESRGSFELVFCKLLEKIERELPPGSELHREQAFALAGQLVGGLLLSRAVQDRTLSDSILLACRQAALRLNAAPAPAEEGATPDPAAVPKKTAAKLRPKPCGDR